MSLNTITFDKERYHLSDRMASWCESRWGPPVWSIDNVRDEELYRWHVRSHFGRTTFHFARDQDLTLFLLVWS